MPCYQVVRFKLVNMYVKYLTDNRADSDHLSKVLLTPDTVYMGPDGKVKLDTQPLQSSLSSDFCAPEWRLQTNHDRSSLEKVK